MNINKENNPTIEQRIERKLQEAEIPRREVEFDPDEAVVGRVNPEQGGVEYRVEFSELGRPPAYDGKTALTIGPRERRVLVLPEVELKAGEKLKTVVALQYRVEEKDNGLKSKFEIK
jgi:hypothetical protein